MEECEQAVPVPTRLAPDGYSGQSSQLLHIRVSCAGEVDGKPCGVLWSSTQWEGIAAWSREKKFVTAGKFKQYHIDEQRTAADITYHSPRVVVITERTTTTNHEEEID